MQEKFFPITNLQFMHVWGSMIYFLAENKLWYINMENMITDHIEINCLPFYGFTVIKDHIVLANKQMLSMYKRE